jgi:hypothetical protein
MFIICQNGNSSPPYYINLYQNYYNIFFICNNAMFFLGQNEIHSDLMSWQRVRVTRQDFFKDLLLRNYNT